MTPLTKKLQSVFSAHSNQVKAAEMSRYMKNHFPYFGISKPERARIQKPFIEECKQLKGTELTLLARQLWTLPHREFQYTCMDMLDATRKAADETMLNVYVDLVTEKSWWDTVDILASNLIGKYCQPNHTPYKSMFVKFSKHENIWLNRVALLHQLKYKHNTDETLLIACISHCKHKKEFFVQKAIGWALRQHSRVNPVFVANYCSKYPLSNLAKREAMKLITSA